MFYCVKCQTIHRVRESREGQEVIFSTGFFFVESTKISAGICNGAEPVDALDNKYC
ncbi:DUF3973 domain-containing protein [Paenibacillus silviterrae]|uniref:DUF3973 domain-containing protein n=1 Tax=Paenibacillus silviterrae TaxID=3242194 RepID=UPI00350E41E4